MAVTGNVGLDTGTGEFVAEKVWTCPVHDRPEWHECDCEHCPWVEPDCCANAEWVDKVDADGNVVMREVGIMERALIRMSRSTFGRGSVLMDALSRPGEMRWNEDDRLPEFTGG